MRRTKTTFATGAALALVLFVAACEGDADAPDAADESPAEGGSIMPPGDPTGGAGDMGTGTGTTGPGTETPDTGVGMDPDSAAGESAPY